MFGKEDRTYDELRDKSIKKWLEDMNQHKDVEVRGGVRVTTDYIAYLKRKIMMLEEKSALKDKYLKKLKEDKHK
jgi:hypothetical protein